MTKVQAFKTADGQVHATELGALKHQHQLDLRGFFNRVGGKDSLAVSEIIGLMQRNHAEITQILTNHEKQVVRVVKRNSKVVTVPV